MMFDCDKCGCCCKNLKKSNLYLELDRGDGVCKYLSNNLCLIYEDRPLLCRIDEYYDKYLYQFMDREEYYFLNKKECLNLKKMEE